MTSNSRWLSLKMLSVVILTMLLLYSLANTYHWMIVIHYPMAYYFPEHSFIVLDKDTKLPVADAMVLYIYTYNTVIQSQDALSPLLDSAGLLLHWTFMASLEPFHCSRASWRLPCVLHLYETRSNQSGKVYVPAYGPIHRLRNHVLVESNTPIVFVLKHGYKIVELDRSRNMMPVKWGYLPPWHEQSVEIKKTSLSSEELAISPSAVYYRATLGNCGCDSVESAIPNALAYLRAEGAR